MNIEKKTVKEKLFNKTVFKIDCKFMNIYAQCDDDFRDRIDNLTDMELEKFVSKCDKQINQAFIDGIELDWEHITNDIENIFNDWQYS